MPSNRVDPEFGPQLHWHWIYCCDHTLWPYIGPYTQPIIYLTALCSYLCSTSQWQASIDSWNSTQSETAGNCEVKKVKECQNVAKESVLAHKRWTQKRLFCWDFTLQLSDRQLDCQSSTSSRVKASSGSKSHTTDWWLGCDQHYKRCWELWLSDQHLFSCYLWGIWNANECSNGFTSRCQQLLLASIHCH